MAAHFHPAHIPSPKPGIARALDSSHETACKTCELSAQARAGRAQAAPSLQILVLSTPVLIKAPIHYDWDRQSFSLARAPPQA